MSTRPSTSINGWSKRANEHAMIKPRLMRWLIRIPLCGSTRKDSNASDTIWRGNLRCCAADAPTASATASCGRLERFEEHSRDESGLSPRLALYGRLGRRRRITGSVASMTVEAEHDVSLARGLSEDDASGFQGQFKLLHDAVSSFIQGKPEMIDLALTCLLSSGHLLVEDVPGVGKTSLARALAAATGAQWRRIQCTPDLLPSDVTGVSVYHQNTATFVFQPGPVFSNIVLADELNRASPRTQSALLEVMQERTVTVDGEPLQVPDPFLVIATQNPIGMEGTYALPEAQIDRFLIKTSVGYPSGDAEIRVLAAHHDGATVADVAPVTTAEDVRELITLGEAVHVEPVVFDYIVRLVGATRDMADLRLGASPRASLGLLRTARVHAASRGRNYVTPSDVQAMARPVLEHRLRLAPAYEAAGGTPERVVQELIENTPAPQGEIAT